MKNKKSNIYILIIVTILVLYFSLKDNFFEIINQFSSLNPTWILLAIFLTILYWCIKTLSLNNIIKKIKKDQQYSQTLKLTLETQFFNAVTPFASGGQPFQVYHLVKKGISLSSSTNIITQNFIVYQIALVSIGIIAVISNNIFNLFPDVGLLKKLVTIGFIINVLIIVFLFLVSFSVKFNKTIVGISIELLAKSKIIKNKEKVTEKWNNYINNFKKNASILIEDKAQFLLNILYNFIALSCLYLVPLFILYSTGDYTSFTALESIVAVAYVMLMGSFVPIPGGTGGLEYGFIAFFGNFISGSKLQAIMLMWRFVTYYLGLFIGAIAINIKKKEN